MCFLFAGLCAAGVSILGLLRPVLDVDADGPLVATMKVFRSLGTCTCTSQCAFAYHRLINRRDAVGALAYNESINRRVTLGWCGLRELWMGFCAA